KVTGIIVVRNEENYIINALESLVKQEIKNIDYDIIIVDGDSTDQTIKKVLEYIESNNVEIPIKIISNPKRTLATGWNIALKESESNYVFRIDAHSEIPLNYITKCLEVLEKDSNVYCVGGRLNSITIGKDNDLIGKVLSSPFGVGNSKFR